MRGAMACFGLFSRMACSFTILQRLATAKANYQQSARLCIAYRLVSESRRSCFMRWPTFLRHKPDLRSVTLCDECHRNIKKLLIGFCEAAADFSARKINITDPKIMLYFRRTLCNITAQLQQPLLKQRNAQEGQIAEGVQ